MRLICLATALALWPGASRAAGVPFEFGDGATRWTMGATAPQAAAPSPFALVDPALQPEQPADKRAPRMGQPKFGPVLSAERARVLLRSLTIPGWGQATLGHHGSAAIFGLAELGVWTGFTSFKIQETLRRQTYERTARLFAGIDLRGKDEEFRRIVGSFISSEEYNRLVVYRDAANLYYDDPVKYRAYIAAHSLTGRDLWSWGSDDDFERYRGQRKNSQRASLRANTMLALAVANRLVSALHAARYSAPSGKHAWNLECVPVGAEDPTAFRFGVRTRF